MREQRYEYVSINHATDSDNKIHSDEMAHEYGFRGALVPGSTTYAHALNPVLDYFGEQWFYGGTAFMRFPKPVYSGESVVVTVSAAPEGAASVSSYVGSELRSPGTATGGGSVDTIDPQFPLIEPPAEPAVINEQQILDFPWLGSVELATDDAARAEFVDNVQLKPGLAEQLGVVHPGYIAGSYPQIMRPTFRRTAPSVHASSLIRSFAPVPHGEPLSLRGRIERMYGRRGHRYWILEMAWYDTKEQIVAHVEHTAIYHLRAPGSARVP